MPNKRLMYHTQGYSSPYLSDPILCTRHDAWLGSAIYFWNEEEDAVYWGINSKKSYKKYSIYTAEVDCEDVLDTVFEEDHYLFWVKCIEKAIKYLAKYSTRKPTIEDINVYLMSKGGWGEKVTGILFQDLPSNETISKVIGFYFRKRIQLAAFDKKIITNFVHHFDGDC